jgi:uncharacterized protein DUF5667
MSMPESVDRLEADLQRIIDGAESPARNATPPADLEPLLRVASRLHSIAAIGPSAAAVQRTRLALVKAVVEAASTTPTRHWSGLRLRVATAVAMALALVAISSIAVLAAPSGLPDSPLYSLRNLRESVELRLAASSRERALLSAGFARQRAAQLRLAVAEKHASADEVNTLLRDITARVEAADREARDAGQPARDAVRQSELGIEADLAEVKARDGLSSSGTQELDKTIQDVRSGESSNASDPTTTQTLPTPEPTATPEATAAPDATATPESSGMSGETPAPEAPTVEPTTTPEATAGAQ